MTDEEFINYVEKENKESKERIKTNGVEAKKAYTDFKKAI